MTSDSLDQAQAGYDNSEIDPREAYPLIDEVMREDWSDPAMDVYDHYEARVKDSPSPAERV